MEVWFEGVRVGEEEEEAGGGGGQAPWLLVGVYDHRHDFATAIMSSILSIYTALTPVQATNHPLCSSFSLFHVKKLDFLSFFTTVILWKVELVCSFGEEDKKQKEHFF